MATDTLLMGLGLPSQLASRIADTNGAVTIAAAGSSATTATKIQGTQFLTYITSGSTTNWVALPTIGGSDNAPQLADDFTIFNGLTTSCTVAIPTGVTAAIAGTSYTGTYTLSTLRGLALWAVNTTQWVGGLL